MSANEQNKLDNDENTQEDAPPLPDEDAPPLPDEQPPLPEEEEPPLPEGEEPPQSSAQAAQPQVLQGNNGWSAIFEPQSQRYYYYNQTTGVTTWDNPFSNIQKEEDKSSNKRQFYQEEDEAIDPDLAHLLPSSSKDPHGYVQAKFNTRTGQFNSKSWQTPEHVSAINKSRRQQAAFFDVDAFERQRNEDHFNKKAKIEQLGKDSVKQKLTKEQLKLYKEQKAAKRFKNKTDWLINDDK